MKTSQLSHNYIKIKYHFVQLGVRNDPHSKSKSSTYNDIVVLNHDELWNRETMTNYAPLASRHQNISLSADAMNPIIHCVHSS